MKLRLDGLRLQLLGLIIIPFSLVLLGVALAGIQVHQQAMRSLVAERDERAVRAAAASLTEQLSHHQAAITAMAQRVADGVPPDLVLDQSSSLRTDFDRGIAVFDAQGRVVTSTTPAEDWANRPVGQLLGASDGQSLFSPVFDDSGSPVLMIASHVGTTYVVGAFTTRMLLANSFLASPGSSSLQGAFLVDGSGRLLDWQGNLPPPAQPLTHPGVKQALGGQTGSSYSGASDGQHVVAFSPVQPTGWALISEEPWQSVTSPLLNNSLLAPLVLIPALLIALLGLWFGARQVIQPLRQLGQEAALLAEDRAPIPSRPISGIAEIRDLRQSLSSMALRIRAAHAALRRYIGQITRAQEDERRRLARELHDETIQELIALDQQAQKLGMDLRAKGAPEADRAEAIRRAASEAIGGIRRMTRALRPIYLEDLGLLPALGVMATSAQEAMGIPVALQRAGTERRLDPNSELGLYRIIQEAVSNVGRHSHALHVWIEIDFGPSGLTCRVKDDGIGFIVPEQNGDLANQGHFGLIGMRERAELAGGKMRIVSGVGAGTTIEIQVPYTPTGADPVV